MGSQPSKSSDVQILNNSTIHKNKKAKKEKLSHPIHKLDHISQGNEHILKKHNAYLPKEDEQIINEINEDLSMTNQNLSNDRNENVEKKHISNDTNKDISNEDQHISNGSNEDINIVKGDQHRSNGSNEDINIVKGDQHISNDTNKDISNEDQHRSNGSNEDINIVKGDQHRSNKDTFCTSIEDRLAMEDRHILNDTIEIFSKNNLPTSNGNPKDILKVGRQNSNNINEDISKDERPTSNKYTSKENLYTSRGTTDDIASENRHTPISSNENISREDQHIKHNNNEDTSEEGRHIYKCFKEDILKEDEYTFNKDTSKENRHTSTEDISKEDRSISNGTTKDISMEGRHIPQGASEYISKKERPLLNAIIEDRHLSKSPTKDVPKEDRHTSDKNTLKEDLHTPTEEISRGDRHTFKGSAEDISRDYRHVSKGTTKDTSKEDRHTPTEDISKGNRYISNGSIENISKDDRHIYISKGTTKASSREDRHTPIKDISTEGRHISNGTNEDIRKEDQCIPRVTTEDFSIEDQLVFNGTSEDLPKENLHTSNEDPSNEDISGADTTGNLLNIDRHITNVTNKDILKEGRRTSSETSKAMPKQNHTLNETKGYALKNSSSDSNEGISKKDMPLQNENKTVVDMSTVSYLNRRSIYRDVKSITKKRLLKTHYTIKEISLHNRGKRQIDIFPFKDNVYSTTKFKNAMRRVVELKYKQFKQDNKTVEPYDYKDFNDKWKCSPIYLVMFRYTKMYIRFADIKPELPGCKVAEVSKEDEMYKDIIHDSKTILQKLTEESKLNEYKTQYEELLEICNLASSDPKSFFETYIPKGQDPNTIEFPLPEQIKSNRKVLRKWISNWKPFVTQIPKEGAWDELPDNVVNAMSDPLDLQDICRVTSDGLADFDFTMEAEAAWNVLELDIVKTDKTTALQEKIWCCRDKRKGPIDPISLFCRQVRLEKYFLDKYDWTISRLCKYRGFTARLQKSWNEFQNLFLEEM